MFGQLYQWLFKVFHNCEKCCKKYEDHTGWSTLFKKKCKVCGKIWTYKSLR
jgi:hypothetical protein